MPSVASHGKRRDSQVSRQWYFAACDSQFATVKGEDGKAEAERDWRGLEAVMQGSGKLLPNRV